METSVAGRQKMCNMVKGIVVDVHQVMFGERRQMVLMSTSDIRLIGRSKLSPSPDPKGHRVGVFSSDQYTNVYLMPFPRFPGQCVGH